MFSQQNVTARDLKLLSSSLDHALTPDEQIEFKKRLAESSHLNTLLAEQRWLKSALADLPMRTVPHNFSLTRAEAQKAKREKILQPVFGWASAISALMAVVIFGSQLIFQNVSLSTPVNTQMTYTMNDAPMDVMENEEAGMKVMAAEPVSLLNWGYGADGLGGGYGKGGGEGVFDSGGVNINIFVNSDDFYTVEAVTENADSEYMIDEFLVDESMEVLQAELLPEPELASEAPATTALITQDHEVPRIFGVDPENAGTVIKMSPDSSAALPEEQVEHQARSGEETSGKTGIPTQITFSLLAAALIFGALWWYLKTRR